MADYREGIKKDVAEIKFLIHDLRVERFINEVIHFHVTVNTDLEIYGIDQAQALHGEDLQELKVKAGNLRKAYHDYCTAVKGFSADQTILANGRRYVESIDDMCGLVLNPRWGRADSVLSFLPEESRSVRSRNHYWNCIRWICGVHTRIEHFNDEQQNRDIYELFDIAEYIQYFTRNVIYGYVTEKSSARVELQLDRLDSAVLGGNRWRFRRMFFNLVMNAVDAMSHKKVGVLNISDVVDADRVVLTVRDDGTGMTEEKIGKLLTDRISLDGELHSLGFVFVRQTVADFKGDLSISSEVDKGTTITITLPHLPGAKAVPRRPAECEKFDYFRESSELATPAPRRGTTQPKPAPVADAINKACGELVYADYVSSDAQFPGCIFAIGVGENGQVDFFTHKPYERDWNMTHEDLSPMLFESTVRGRLEEDGEKKPVLILKAPQNVRQYFEFRSVPEAARDPGRYAEMVHDEYIRVARKLIDTGLSPQTGVHLTDLQKFFPQQSELHGIEPLPLEVFFNDTATTEIGA
jgi:hypothetical protein